MGKTRGAHSFRPWVRQGPTPPIVGPFASAGPSVVGPSAASPSAAAGPSAAAAGTSPSVPVVRPSAAAAYSAPSAVQNPPVSGDVEGSSSVAPAQRRYHTRVGPTPPAPSHPRPARRAPPAKKARTLGSGESSTD